MIGVVDCCYCIWFDCVVSFALLCLFLDLVFDLGFGLLTLFGCLVVAYLLFADVVVCVTVY